MKKLHLLFVMAFMAVIGLASCENPNKEADAVAQKLQAGEQLSEQEITDLINYVGEYAKKAQGDVDDEINGTDTEQAHVDMEKLNEEYKYVDLFRNYLKNVDFTTLSNENLELIGNYAHYEEFTVPAKMDFSVDPAEKAAGFIEEGATTDSSAVIATDVPQAVEKN